MAALSHYDVLKTTEPLTCSDGVRNFTCLLSKTDITPVLRELKKIDVAPEVSPVARRWVLVLDFNFTEGSWRWRNITVVRGWELKWNNETVYVFQAPIKKSLGEMVKMNRELSEAFFVRRELKNITAVAVYADKIAIGTSNGTTTDGKATTSGKDKPDRKTIERIREYIKKRYGDIIVEVYYTRGATLDIEMAGDYPINTYFRSDGRYKYENGGSCTLGYLGYLYGDPNLPVIITAWHCFGYVGTDRTSPYIAAVLFEKPDGTVRGITAPGSNSFFNPGPYYWGWRIKPVLFVQSDSAVIGRVDPDFFERNDLEFGKVRKADGRNDLPIMLQLTKYDVKIGDSLWIRLGRSDAVSRNVVNSLCASLDFNLIEWIKLIIDPSKYYIPVWDCHTRLSAGTYEPIPGDSGSPVYRLRIGPDYRYAVVDAYGIHIGMDKETKEVYVADISWIYVKVSWLG
jgi:hypothetical protein